MEKRGRLFGWVVLGYFLVSGVNGSGSNHWLCNCARSELFRAAINNRVVSGDTISVMVSAMGMWMLTKVFSL